jgi:hypothetical protein
MFTTFRICVEKLGYLICTMMFYCKSVIFIKKIIKPLLLAGSIVFYMFQYVLIIWFKAHSLLLVKIPVFMNLITAVKHVTFH